MVFKLKNEEDHNLLSLKEVVLKNRGIEDAKEFLDNSEEAIESFEGLMFNNNFAKAGKKLFNALRSKQKIYVLVDCDVDGFTSAAILGNYIYRQGYRIFGKKIVFGFHEGKSHGLEEHMERILQGNYNLVISPDGSSSDFKYHKQLKEKGIDLIILDHHEVELESGYEDAIIINNNAIIDGKKLEVNSQISGAGIVYKFCQYCDKVLKTSCVKGLEDLVSFGMIGDMMNITNLETKQMIFKGLKNNKIKNKFLRSSIDKQEKQIKMGKMTPSVRNDLEVAPNALAWYVCPKINSVCRCGSMTDKEDVFKSLLEEFNKEPKIIEKAFKIANSANYKQRKEVAEAEKRTNEEIEQFLRANPNANYILLLGEDGEKVKDVYRGLLANKLVRKYSLPTMIMTLGEDEEGNIVYAGSARGCAPRIKSFKKIVSSCSSTFYAQGHDNAFGVSVLAKDLETFKEQLAELLIKEESKEDSTFVDFIWTENSNDLTESNILDLQTLIDYVGSGFDSIEVGLNLDLNECDVQIYEKISKLNLKTKNIEVIAFGEQNQLKELIENNTRYISCLCELGRNEYMGNIKGQLIIKEVEASEETEETDKDVFELLGF